MYPEAGYYLVTLSEAGKPLDEQRKLSSEGITLDADDQTSCRIFIHDNIPYILPIKGDITLCDQPISDECLLSIETDFTVGKQKYQLTYYSTPDKQMESEIYLSATTDPLTGALNEYEFQERASAEIAYSVRHGSPLSLLTIDIDFLSMINDSLGYEAGNAIFRDIARCINHHRRTEDIFARYDGSHLLLLIRGEEAGHADEIANRVREEIEAIPATQNSQDNIHYTVSIGICTCDDGSSLTLENLIRQSADALEIAKNRGRNCVCATCYSRII